MNKLAAVLAGVWLGLQLGIGYVAVPLLFQHMGKMEAGAMAGSMFDFVAYTGLAVWLLLYFIGRHELGRSLMRSKTNKFVLLLLSLLGGSFGQWHGISSVIYMLCSLLALGLVFRLLKLDWH